MPRPRKILTLCIVHQHPRVLLGMKKRGFGEGKWNGFGGKVEHNESIEEAARREMVEESGVELSGIEKVGVLDFEFKNEPEILEVHVFRSESFSGVPQESEEMRPEWFHIDDIPFADMWPDDRHWFPYFLKKKKFKGRCCFDGEGSMIDVDISEVSIVE